MILLLILLSALAGLIVSWHIYYKKNKNEKLVCIIGKDCNTVVHSKYSKILAVPNEILGMIYYGLVIFLALLLLSGFSGINFSLLVLILIFTGGAAALFSLIFIYIQAFILKEWCEYCLISAGLSIAIFILDIMALL